MQLSSRSSTAGPLATAGAARRLDERHLMLLVALADHGSLGAAASAINLSASAASRRLSDAERRIGITLAVVSGRSLTLTPSGAMLAAAARTAFRDLADAEFSAQWLDRGDQRPVEVGLGFHDQWASLARNVDLDEVAVRRGGDPMLGDAVRRGELDLFIDVHAAAPAGATVLASDRLAAMVSTVHPLAARSVIEAADFLGETYLASARNPKPGFEYELLFRPEGASPISIVDIDSITTVLDLVADGRGVTIQPARSRALHARASAIVAIPLSRSIDVVWCAHVAAGADARVRAIVDGLGRAVTELPGTPD